MTLALVNIGVSHDGSLAGGQIQGDAIVCEAGRIAWIGDSSAVAAAEHDTTIDIAGATLVPGLVDSHVHTTFGDYTPRQRTLDFLDSYVHGGTTRVLSASEVHVPGRPTGSALCRWPSRPRGVSPTSGRAAWPCTADRSFWNPN